MTRTMNLLAALVAASFGSAAQAAVSADEAKALGTNLTAIGAEKAANKDGTIPAYTGGMTTAAGRLQGRRRHPSGPVRGREAAPRGRRQEHGRSTPTS